MQTTDETFQKDSIQTVQSARTRAMVGVCECEHVTHFDDGAPEPIAERYCAHVYGAKLPVEATPTDYGTFFLCSECITRGHTDLGAYS